MADTTDRIKALLPAHFQITDDTVLNTLIETISMQLDKVRTGITNIMTSKWVDFSTGTDLERFAALFNIKRLKDEPEPHFRQRLKDTVREMLGSSCTAGAIQKLVEAMTGVRPEIVENPAILKTTQEFYLNPADRLFIHSGGIENTHPTIMIRALETVRNPTLINLSTEEALTCRGVLRKGAYLVINPDCTADLGGVDVSDTIKSTSPNTPLILKGVTEWCYTDATAFFDNAKFDDTAFGSTTTHAVGITLKWYENQAAVFLVKMPLYTKKGLEKKVSFETELRQEVRKIVDSIKPCGVAAKVNYWDDFSEFLAPQKDFLAAQFSSENLEIQPHKEYAMSLEVCSHLSEKLYMKDWLSIGSAFDIAKFDSKFRFG